MNATPHYNPDWLSDDALLANFVARQSDFSFLRDELSRAPAQGNVQHYLLVGVRGAGKTTLLKRLAVAIRRDMDLNQHLIALSFPEDLYQVKNLADFWWAACDALTDELDFLQRGNAAHGLMAAIKAARLDDDRSNPLSEVGFRLLQQTCAQLALRPVMLVDNLDMVFQRIDKNGRKLNDPHAPAYWALREALSTSASPIVIGCSVRLSAPFKDYDKAFYDFFLPKRLGKLSRDEARQMLDHLAEAHGLPDLRARLRARSGRIDALFELSGGNPRALGLVFELLRNAHDGRAVADFERLMDLATPYYKARIEDLSEQAQVLMHALAVHGIVAADGLRFGHTAAELGLQSGLPTSTVSAQLVVLENQGLVDKCTDHGRAQYRIAEQLFRLWLQMRSTRRIRQNVIGLTLFFEAMYEVVPWQITFAAQSAGAAPAEAKFAFVIAAVQAATLSQLRELPADGADRMRRHIGHGGKMEQYLPAYQLSAEIASAVDGVSWKRTALESVLRGIDCSAGGDPAAAERAYRQAISIDPASVLAWTMLGIEAADDPARQQEAEAALRSALAIKPDCPYAWSGLAAILENVQRDEEALLAYHQMGLFDGKQRSCGQTRHLGLIVRLCTAAARAALASGNQKALLDALRRLLADPPDTALALLDDQFVAGFLVPILADHAAAEKVFMAMRELGYAQHARPLLLAFEAVMAQRAEMLDQLEPELQDATRRMYLRLTA